MNSANSLEGKKILVTGATSGIGKAIAFELSACGADIALNYRPRESNEEKSAKIIKEICENAAKLGCASLKVPADISKEEQVIEMFQTVKKEWGRLDVLVNNAGIQKAAESHRVGMEDFSQVIDVNLYGSFFCAREALKLFLANKTRGAIVNISSVHDLIPKPNYLSYAMAKGALKMMTKTLALEYAGRGVRVNAVSPGAVETPINPWAGDEKEKQEVASHIPLQRVAQGFEIAKTARFLCSDDSSYTTGQTFYVDGGLTLYPEYREDWSSN